MSTSVPQRPVINPVRRQLDELDELLQRMLELPVNHLDEEAFAGTPAASDEEDGPARPRVFRPDRGDEQPLPGPHRPSEGRGLASLITVASTDQTLHLLREPEPAADAATLPSDDSIATTPEQTDRSSSSEIPPDPPMPGSAPAPQGPVGLPKPPVWMRSLIWCNTAFDRVTERLGDPGRWARRSRGRSVLGWVGLGLLGFSLALLLLDWIGWPR